ncbi:type II secretion system protein [bacterium]|nr:type II secretion system protein [bacterium]
MKKFAFTLAETLIVMGIIGVVAALTLPNLNSSTGDKEKVAKVKKIYQNLNDAFGRAQAVYGPYEDWCINITGNDCSKRCGERITEFMKISKNCELSDETCFADKPVNLDNGSKYMDAIGKSTYKSNYRFITSDGTSIALGGITLIDIDGPNKGNNSMGRDIFMFEIINNSIVPECSRQQNVFQNFSLSPSTRGTCSSLWIISFDNADYLKIDSNGKCPDGKTILDGTTNITCK